MAKRQPLYPHVPKSKFVRPYHGQLFQRRHYEVIAELLRRQDHLSIPFDSLPREEYDLVAIDRSRLCNEFADMFARDNALFDRQKFMDAVGE